MDNKSIFEPKSIFSVLAEVQEAIEQPKLNAEVRYKNTHFRYADLGELWRVVRAATKGKGLFIHHTEEGGYICVIAHLGDQSAELSRCPANLTGDPQDVGSALTYAKRYSLAAAFGLVAEEDDDGQRGANQVVTAKSGKKPATGEHSAAERLKAAKSTLANACAVSAAATGKTTEQVMTEVTEREDYKQGDAACYERIAAELLEGVNNG
jgi:hypothetical protein